MIIWPPRKFATALGNSFSHNLAGKFSKHLIILNTSAIAITTVLVTRKGIVTKICVVVIKAFEARFFEIAAFTAIVIIFATLVCLKKTRATSGLFIGLSTRRDTQFGITHRHIAIGIVLPEIAAFVVAPCTIFPVRIWIPAFISFQIILGNPISIPTFALTAVRIYADIPTVVCLVHVSASACLLVIDTPRWSWTSTVRNVAVAKICPISTIHETPCTIVVVIWVSAEIVVLETRIRIL
mmetsp:Transcript_25663/g.46447  ORF Transcript_25663/g.46447 Transcript_25663/m.46447 type:complete len:239 (-) Transcript_25663:161-877(-)